MAKTRALKVYKTSIGFHDAYVAAPSQKAALDAWGSDKNLFARGVAEIVTDPKLVKDALAQPGVVIRKLRGTPAEQIAALPKARPKSGKPKSEAKPKLKPTASGRPRPSRDRLAKVEADLDAVQRQYDVKLSGLDAQIALLSSEKRSIESKRDAELGKLESMKAREQRAYQDALEAWQG